MGKTGMEAAMMMFKVETKARLWHLASLLSARKDCQVSPIALHFEGEAHVLVKPFVDVYGGDVLLPVHVVGHSNKNLIMRHLEEEGLFVNQVDLSDAAVGMNESSFEGLQSSIVQTLEKAKHLPLNDLFGRTTPFPGQSRKELDSEQQKSLNAAFDMALDVATKLVEQTDSVDFTLITYPEKIDKPVAFEVPMIEGDEQAKDAAVRHMATILLMTDTEMYSVISEAWQYEVDKDGNPDRSKRVEILMATTVHKSGVSRSAFRPILRDEKGQFQGWGEMTDTSDAMTEGRFVEMFNLLPTGKAHQRHKREILKTRTSKKGKRRGPIKRTLH